MIPSWAILGRKCSRRPILLYFPRFFRCDFQTPLTVRERIWPSRSRLGAMLDHLGPSWGHLGAILAPSWVHLGSSWGQVGPSGAILGVSRAILRPSLAILGSRCSRKRKVMFSLVMLRVLDTVLGHLGAISGPSWNQREPILSLHRAILDPGHLGAHGGH